MALKQGLGLNLKTRQRMALLGRLRMADWIEMPEKEFSKEIEKIEKDSLFQMLFFGKGEFKSVIRRQRWPHSRMSGSFYEVNEQITAGRERVEVEEKLDARTSLVSKIRKIGVEAFEKYFLHADEPFTIEEISRRTGLDMDDVRAVYDLLLEIDVQSEFQGKDRAPALARSYSCLARISLEGGKPSFEFFSSHWARGLYQIRYDLVEKWKEKGVLAADQRRKLPRLLKRIETLNLRQSTLFRVLESIMKLQLEYLTTRSESKMMPISLRQLASRLDLAPSTVSRALCGRSVRLPWELEVPLIRLVPGRRKVLREILAGWLSEDSSKTDEHLAGRLKEEYSIKVSRRTVNAVRNELKKKPAL